MRGAGVDFNLRREVRFGEGLLQDRLVVGRPRVVIGSDCDEELRFGLGSLKMRAVRGICYQSAAVE